MSYAVCQVASVVSDSLQPHGLQPTMLLCPWTFEAGYQSSLPFPSLGGFSSPGIEPMSPELQVDSLPLSQCALNLYVFQSCNFLHQKHREPNSMLLCFNKPKFYKSKNRCRSIVSFLKIYKHAFLQFKTTGSIPGLGKSPGEGNGKLLQQSYTDNKSLSYCQKGLTVSNCVSST